MMKRPLETTLSLFSLHSRCTSLNEEIRDVHYYNSFEEVLGKQSLSLQYDTTWLFRIIIIVEKRIGPK